MRKSWITTAGLLALILAACTGETAPTLTSLTQTTTPAETTTTTRPQIVDGGLVPVDPATLVPVPGSKSITQGKWFQGTVSPSGKRLALLKLMNNAQEWVEVVDLETNEVVAETRVPQGASGLQISNDGTAFWVTGGNRMTLFRLAAGANDREKVFDKFPEDFFTDAFQLLGDERFGFFGITSTDGVNRGEASIVIVDAEDDSMTQIPLPKVDMGIIGETEPGDDVETLEIANPVAVWDSEKDRVLIVEATRDVVTEVSLSDGEIVEHPWRTPEAGLGRLFAWLIPTAQAKGLTGGVTRDAVLSADGGRLFVATSVREIEDDKQVSSPLDLVVLDTETWDATAIDAQVDTLYPSPDGVFLLAQGVEVTEGESDLRASPVYVIDMVTAELLIGFQTSDIGAADVSFSRDGAEAYITTWSESDMKIDILDMGLLQLTGAVEFPEISLIGEAGLMAFHFDE